MPAIGAIDSNFTIPLGKAMLKNLAPAGSNAAYDQATAVAPNIPQRIAPLTLFLSRITIKIIVWTCDALCDYSLHSCKQ